MAEETEKEKEEKNRKGRSAILHAAASANQQQRASAGGVRCIGRLGERARLSDYELTTRSEGEKRTG